jgi:mono/diheme cytochrome c family protein
MAFVGLGLLTAGLPGLGQARPLCSAHSQKLEKNVSGNGRLIFDSKCAGCHGLDGRGGERAPDLTARNVQQLSDQEISRIVVNSVAGTAMPAFHLLRQSEMATLLGYIRSLQGKDYGKAALPGEGPEARSGIYDPNGWRRRLCPSRQ